MSSKLRFCVWATAGILLTMNVWKRLKTTLDQKIGEGVEFVIEDCLSVQGCRLAVFKEAEKRGARLITNSIEEAISSENGGLKIKLGFQDDVTRGAFLDAVCTWCEFHDLTMGARTFFDDIRLGRPVQAHEYKEDDTTSPPGARARSRSRSSEGTPRTCVTDILDPKDEQVVFQSFEVAERFTAMDSCHLLSSSKCKGTPADSDPSNRLACSTGFHRAFDGTSARYPPWVRISVVSVDISNAIECTGRGGRVHHRFRVHLSIEFMTEEHREAHRFCWKEGTVDDGKNPVLTFVDVEDHVMFCNGIDWKYRNTKEIWDSKAG